MLTRARKFLGRVLPVRPETESKLISDAQGYWTDKSDTSLPTNSHWRGNGPFENDELWLALGANHVRLVERAHEWTNRAFSGPVAVEWGCGGGMNAVQFAPHCSRYYGVDISADSLAECDRQVRDAGYSNFTGVRIDAAAPEAVSGDIPETCDLFLCTYVFELLPTPEYGVRMLAIASRLMNEGGIALLQIRYNNGAMEQQSLRRNYERNAAQMTTYLVDEFWQHCERAGLTPLFVTLVPDQPELREQRYAYFALQKTPSASSGTRPE